MTLSLHKGQTVSLAKLAGGLTSIRMGLAWDAAKKTSFFGIPLGQPKQIDLDASCLMLDARGKLLDTVWFRQLNSHDGSVHHSGDNRTGDGDGDDETIFVDLAKLGATVSYLVFTVNSFTGQTFKQVQNAACRLVDQTNDHEVVRFDLAEKGNHTGVIMAMMYRISSGWGFRAVGSATNGTTVLDLVPAVKREIARELVL
jgi:tellurium resistance protein TerZ